MRNLKKKGFTIVELVIVIAVIAVLAAVLIPTFVNLTKKANQSAKPNRIKNNQPLRNHRIFYAVFRGQVQILVLPSTLHSLWTMNVPTLLRPLLSCEKLLAKHSV